MIQVEDESSRYTTNVVVCKSYKWIHSDVGGILTVTVKANQYIQKGDILAQVKSVFGHLIKEYAAQEEGIVIGKSTNPINEVHNF
jgi:uncharacterized protein